MRVNFCFGANTGMKWARQPALFEQPPQLVTNLGPFFVDLPVAPLMKEASAGREHSMGLTQDGAPVNRQVKETSDDNGAEAAIGEWKSRPFGRHGEHGAVAGLRAELGQHAGSRLERDDDAAVPGQRDRHSSGARADIENSCAR